MNQFSTYTLLVLKKFLSENKTEKNYVKLNEVLADIDIELVKRDMRLLNYDPPLHPNPH